jgi:hypothetical protein
MSGQWQPGDRAGWSQQESHSSSAFIRLGVVMAVVIVVAVLIVGAIAPVTPPAECPAAPAPCSVPPAPPGGIPSTPAGGQGALSATAELVNGPGWSSSEFGFSVHYDSDDWVIQENDKDLLQLISPSDSSGSERDDWVIIEGVPAASATPQQLIDARVASLAKSVPDLAADSDPYYRVNGAEIGDVAGVAAVYVGTLDDTDGTPVAPVRYSIVAASNGKVTVALTVRTLNPDEIADHGPPVLTWHMYSRQLADVLLEDFRWPAAP